MARTKVRRTNDKQFKVYLNEKEINIIKELTKYYGVTNCELVRNLINKEFEIITKEKGDN